MSDELERYIRENRERYTPDALREHLAAAGHDAAEVEAAWAAVEASDRAPASPDPQPVSGLRYLVTGLSILVVGLAFGLAILAAAIYALSSGSTYGPASIQVVTLIIYILAMSVALVFLVRRLAQGQTPAGTWTRVAGAFALSVAAFLGLSGACMAGLSMGG